MNCRFKKIWIFKKYFLTGVCFFPLIVLGQIDLIKEIEGDISPKSIVHNQEGVFAAQNMMYKHSVTFYNARGELMATVPDKVNLNDFGYHNYTGKVYRGGPVEACFSGDKKYLWVSNYSMIGKGFEHEGCDGCSGKSFDPSFLYKINTKTYKIENIIKVGSVPKFVSISDNGRLLLVSNWTSSDVSIIDLDNEKEIKRVDVGAMPRGIVIDKNNQYAYITIMGSNKIARVNLLNYSVKYINNVGRSPRHILINKANTLLYVSNSSDNRIAKIEISTGNISHGKVNSGPRSMVMSPDERWIYVVNYHQSTFQKINAKNLQVVRTVKTDKHPIGITADWKSGEIWVSCYEGIIQIFKDKNLKLTPKEIGQKIGENKCNLASRIPNQRVGDFEYASSQRESQVSNYRFHIIVGSFTEPVNAVNYEKFLFGKSYLPQRIVSGDNRTMVSVQSFDNKLAALAELPKIKSLLNKEAWIYKEPCS